MKACLTFDFIGALPDESSDENGSIQAPTSWRVVFEEQVYLNVLWECFKSSNPPVSVLAMECLSQAASIRRSIFSTEDSRHVYVQRIMQEIIFTLTTDVGQRKLQDTGNFHEFCRMLSRFNTTFQLTEICERKEFEQWISAISEFTSQGFHSWKVKSRGIRIDHEQRVQLTDRCFFLKLEIVVAEQCSLSARILEQNRFIYCLCVTTICRLYYGGHSRYFPLLLGFSAGVCACSHGRRGRW